MIKKTILANTAGQSLKEHSIAIALYGDLLLKSFNFKESIEKELSICLIYSALLHDIGKVSNGFQKFINKSRNAENSHLEDMPMDAEAGRQFKGPFHNEISWAYTNQFIDFSNNKNQDIICHSVYWHHPANCSKKGELHFENAKKVFDGITKNLREDLSKLFDDIYSFVKDLFNSFSSDYYSIGIFNNPDLKQPDKNNIRELQCPKFFSHEIDKAGRNAKKQLCLNLLLESDRTVSSWTMEKLKNFLEQWKTEKIFSNKIEKFPVLENMKADKRSEEQYNLAKEMSHKKLSVCGVDPAGGKTSISLYWRHECKSEYPLIIALPTQNQVTGLFESIKGDCKRIYTDQKIKIEAVFNGKRQYKNWNPEDENNLLISDINILVFDRFLSPYYKRSQSSEFLRMLKSHLVLDEFHEFKFLPNMIPALKEILTIRSWLESEVKTLMLSGTPEPSLLKLLDVEGDQVFKRLKLASRDDHKFKMFMKEENLQKNEIESQKFFKDCLYSFLRVESCQKLFSSLLKTSKNKIKMIHSYFTTEDKKDLLRSILEEHGKGKGTSQKAVITAKMLQSSYNLSFNKAIVELSQPHIDCQTAGRINRFENKTSAEIHFIFNEKSESFFNENKAGFKEIHKNWREHLKRFIESKADQFVSIRELMKSYDDFWSEDNVEISLNILKKQQEKVISELNKYIPKRFFSKQRSNSTTLNSLFRGSSLYLSACVVNEQGCRIGQLFGDDLLTEGKDWVKKSITDVMKICLKYKSKCEKANKIKEEEVFEYYKHAPSFGFKVEKPLLCSHYNTEIDEFLLKHLRDEDNDSTYYKVYNKKFGLVNKKLFDE